MSYPIRIFLSKNLGKYDTTPYSETLTDHCTVEYVRPGTPFDRTRDRPERGEVVTREAVSKGEITEAERAPIQNIIFKHTLDSLADLDATINELVLLFRASNPTAPAPVVAVPSVEGEIDYFVGNADGRGLIRIEFQGHHIASLPRGMESEEWAKRLVDAYNSILLATTKQPSGGNVPNLNGSPWQQYLEQYPGREINYTEWLEEKLKDLISTTKQSPNVGAVADQITMAKKLLRERPELAESYLSRALAALENGGAG